MSQDKNLIEAIRLLKSYTRFGSVDPWDLSGDLHKKVRQHVYTVLMGSEKKIPIAKCGVTAIRAELYKRANIEGDCIAVRDENFRNYCKEIIGDA